MTSVGGALTHLVRGTDGCHREDMVATVVSELRDVFLAPAAQRVTRGVSPAWSSWCPGRCSWKQRPTDAVMSRDQETDPGCQDGPRKEAEGTPNQ